MEKILRYLLICTVAMLTAGGCSNGPDPDPDPNPKPDPKPDPKPEYVIDVKADYAIGVMEFGDPSVFSLVLSQMEVKLDDAGSNWVVTAAGELVLCEIWADVAEKEPLPAGKYRYVSNPDAASEAKTFFTQYVVCDEAGALTPTQFSEAELSVVLDAGIYTFELTGKTTKGETLRFTHKGAVEFPSDDGGGDTIFPPMEQDAEVTFTIAKAAYVGKTTSGASHFDVRLSDYDYTGGNEPGYILILPMFGAISDGALALAPGTYTVAAEYAKPQTYKAGDIQPGKVDNATLQNKGANLVNTRMEDRLVQYYGFVASGVVTVTMTGDVYKLDINLVDDNGFKIKATYEGALEVQDKSYHSTLKEDVTMDLTGADCEIFYNGQFYDDVEATSWLIQITSGRDGADAIQLEFLTPIRTMNQGIPAGLYGITSEYVPGHSVCLAGTTDGFDLFRSWFLRGLAGTVAKDVAPLKEGSVTVKISGNQYTFDIKGYDDAPVGHWIKGSWTGTPTYSDATPPQQSGVAAKLVAPHSRIPFRLNGTR